MGAPARSRSFSSSATTLKEQDEKGEETITLNQGRKVLEKEEAQEKEMDVVNGANSQAIPTRLRRHRRGYGLLWRIERILRRPKPRSEAKRRDVSSASSLNDRGKILEDLTVDLEVIVATYRDSLTIFSHFKRQRRGGCILLRLKPIPGADVLDESLRDGATRVDRLYTELIGTYEFGAACRDGIARPVLASTVSHLRLEVMSVLQAALDTRMPIDLLRVRVSSDVARNCAVQALDDLRTRILSTHDSSVRQLSKASWKKWREWSVEEEPTRIEMNVPSVEVPGEHLKEKAGESSQEEPSKPMQEENTELLEEEKRELSEEEKRYHFLNTPAEIYDLAPRLLPRAQKWRWCEGACRLRGNASLSVSDISSTSSDTKCQTVCKYCNHSGFDIPLDKVVIIEPNRMLKFAMKCHVFTMRDPREKEEFGFMCHICILRNPYDGAAGPWSLEGLRWHVDARHSKL